MVRPIATDFVLMILSSVQIMVKIDIWCWRLSCVRLMKLEKNGEKICKNSKLRLKVTLKLPVCLGIQLNFSTVFLTRGRGMWSVIIAKIRWGIFRPGMIIWPTQWVFTWNGHMIWKKHLAGWQMRQWDLEKKGYILASVFEWCHHFSFLAPLGRFPTFRAKSPFAKVKMS